VFSNRPGQGGGYTLTPNRAGASISAVPGDASGLIVVGLLAVGAYLVFK
jgi:hypothetical protein